MEEKHARLLQAIDYLKDKGQIHKQQDIADKLGKGKSYISEVMANKNGRLTDGFLRSFAAAYSDYITESWLLTGEGNMEVPAKTKRPHFDVTAAAGFMDGIADGITQASMREVIEGMPRYDFTIDVSGDSMRPQILNRDTLLCRIVADPANPPIGKACVVDTIDGAVVKVIAAATGDAVTLHSFNPDYPDYDIPASSINRVAIVVGFIRTFSM